MNAALQKRLEAAGFEFGTVGELFGLSEAEEQSVEMKVALAEAARARDRLAPPCRVSTS